MHNTTKAEQERMQTHALYLYEEELSPGICIGLDEVGRGPLAGPLVVGAVVLDRSDEIVGINDSKKLSPNKRERLYREIKERACATATAWVAPHVIDEQGITYALKHAFYEAAEATGMLDVARTVIIDGTPLHLFENELSVVKGDSRLASIAAASIVAKVERDAYMIKAAKRYPAYGFEQHKGYGTKAHREAIRTFGLTPLHRSTFCTKFL